MKILTVLNSQRAIGCAAPGAGVQLKEVAVPCNFLSDAGAALTLATQFSGRLHLPAGHTDNASQTLAVRRFKQDGSARVALAGTRAFDVLAARDCDAVFHAAGHEAGWEWRAGHRSVNLDAAPFCRFYC